MFATAIKNGFFCDLFANYLMFTYRNKTDFYIITLYPLT